LQQQQKSQQKRENGDAALEENYEKLQKNERR
jgi:hypothetical protein